MIKYEEALLDKVSVHFIGNGAARDGVRLTDEPVDITDERLNEVLLDFFFKQFREPEFFALNVKNEEGDLNEMYQLAAHAFDNPVEIHQVSIEMANHLYQQSTHPNIKSGDLMVAVVKNIVIEEQSTSAICILKSETKGAFLQLKYQASLCDIHFERGISISKIDKACLILNTNKSEGFKVCIIDKSNNEGEANFWKNGFLNLKERNDSYHKTKNVIELTEMFVKEHLKDNHEIEKSEEIQLMNSSADYFKHMDQFEMEEYEKSVFKNNKVIEQFQDYTDNYRIDNNVQVSHKFDISKPAFKSSSKVFKSVVKLDRNFSLYIHGNRDMVERGVDPDGRKYYKLYYEEER